MRKNRVSGSNKWVRFGALKFRMDIQTMDVLETIEVLLKSYPKSALEIVFL